MNSGAGKAIVHEITESDMTVQFSLFQHHSSKASLLWYSAFFMVQFSHLYMTTGKTIALTRWTFVGKMMSLLLNTLSRYVIAFLPRSKHFLISWLQSSCTVILELKKIKVCHCFLLVRLLYKLLGVRYTLSMYVHGLGKQRQ